MKNEQLEWIEREWRRLEDAAIPIRIDQQQRRLILYILMYIARRMK